MTRKAILDNPKYTFYLYLIGIQEIKKQEDMLKNWVSIKPSALSEQIGNICGRGKYPYRFLKYDEKLKINDREYSISYPGILEFLFKYFLDVNKELSYDLLNFECSLLLAWVEDRLGRELKFNKAKLPSLKKLFIDILVGIGYEIHNLWVVENSRIIKKGDVAYIPKKTKDPFSKFIEEKDWYTYRCFKRLTMYFFLEKAGINSGTMRAGWLIRDREWIAQNIGKFKSSPSQESP